MINKYRLHRVVGIALLCPLAAWSLTGMVFLIQPGYGAAYEALRVKTYPLDTAIEIPADPQWQELRVLRTVLGTHLIANTHNGNIHLNALTSEPFPDPTDAQKTQLVLDAIEENKDRYGSLTAVDGELITTSSGIEIRLHWDTLSLQQYGNDTRWIDRLYRVHYLQWTGIKTLDKLLGITGLVLLLLISITGINLLRTPRLPAA